MYMLFDFIFSSNFQENGLNDFIYSDSGSDSDGNFNEEYSSAAAISNQLNDSAGFYLKIT